MTDGTDGPVEPLTIVSGHHRAAALGLLMPGHWAVMAPLTNERGERVGDITAVDSDGTAYRYTGIITDKVTIEALSAGAQRGLSLPMPDEPFDAKAFLEKNP